MTAGLAKAGEERRVRQDDQLTLAPDTESSNKQLRIAGAHCERTWADGTVQAASLMSPRSGGVRAGSATKRATHAATVPRCSPMCAPSHVPRRSPTPRERRAARRRPGRMVNRGNTDRGVFARPTNLLVVSVS